MKNTFIKLNFLLLLISNSSFGQDFKFNQDSLNNFLESEHLNNRFDGVALIALNNSIIYKKNIGYANNGTKKHFDLTTKFQIASISKQFTSFGILILEQENKLNTNDFVQKHLTDFPFKNIQIKHLMSHTSGMPNFIESMWKDLDTTKVTGNVEMLEMLKSNKYPLQWQPGEKWEYSDIAYCTLATIIEKVSRMSFKKFMEKKLFTPAGMNNTTAEFSTDYRTIKSPELAIGYVYDTITQSKLIAYDVPENNFIRWLGGFYGDGSVVSTAEDLVKWDNALYEGKIISRSSLEKAMTPTILNNGDKVKAWGANYGFGWFLYNSPNFGQIQTHTGGHPGYSSRITRCPDKHLTFILLSNLSIPRFWEINLLNELEKQQ